MDLGLLIGEAHLFPLVQAFRMDPILMFLQATYDISFNIQTGAYLFESTDQGIMMISPIQQIDKLCFKAFGGIIGIKNFPNGWSNYLAELAPRLKEIGIDAIWIPPSMKNSGTNSVGYAPFDHYDLGDKYQKGLPGYKDG